MKIQRLISIAVLPFVLVSAWGQSPRNLKTWKFSLPHGSLGIDVEKTSDGSLVLGFGPEGSIPEAPVVEQVDALKQVLREMPQYGFDPTKLSYVETHLWATDATEKLAYACADSAAWRSLVRSGGRGKGRLVVELL